jgi:hypothetical protein
MSRSRAADDFEAIRARLIKDVPLVKLGHVVGSIRLRNVNGNAYIFSLPSGPVTLEFSTLVDGKRALVVSNLTDKQLAELQETSWVD